MKHTTAEQIKFLLPKCEWCFKHSCKQEYILKRFNQLIKATEKLLKEIDDG